MSDANPTSDDPIDDVAPGDIITADGGDGARPYKVVHIAATDGGYLVTLEDDSDGETFQQEFAAGTRVTRSLESKWESEQSPTPHTDVPE
ncbi:hypothetical protein FK535_01835 [Mycolicibacterium sp. 018/SC-01/001]|uniref:hypothetical protein n=1 Tax=Mycolicibacterium sp. 018/SC-01/001 TaxID=2592069 RepID=UPI00118048EC|nr:hypothetical protein [Mycolicibacterium sp. 018/SC-01/001]TRW89030.1 hypothetical protein FK535_01835 [Mycolicibacterium sp. 018/SC-01/001]